MSIKKDSYVVEKADPKRAGIALADQSGGTVKIRWSYGKEETVSAAGLEESGVMTYYWSGPIQEVLGNGAAFALTQKCSKFVKMGDFSWSDLKYEMFENSIYEIAKTFFTRGGDYTRAFRLFGDPDDSTVNDFFASGDATDALNKTISVGVVDKIVRAMSGSEKFMSLKIGRYLQYAIAYYLSNLASRKFMGTKDGAYTHY